MVVENFLTACAVESLRASCGRLVSEMDPAEHRGVFSTTSHNQARDEYFLNSGDKIRFFFETDSFEVCGLIKLGLSEISIPKC